MTQKELTLEDIYIYELNSSIWAGWMPFGYTFILSYYMSKAKRKYNRYTFVNNLIRDNSI